jgi:histidine triad (HIT) family protein
MIPYEPDNIFTKIMRGEIPCHKVFEDENCFVFMDIMPQSDGHALVLPKSGSRNILDASAATLGATIQRVQQVAQAAMTAFDADGVAISQFNEPAAGQTVFHLHFHVIPRYDDVAPRQHTGAMAENSLLASHATKLREALDRVIQ